jgi:hypothetical protein
MDHSEVNRMKCHCGLDHGFHTHEQWEDRHASPKVDHTPAELDGPSKALLDAAAWIEQNGLCQRNADERGRGSDGSGCVIYALWTVSSEHSLEAQQRLQKRITDENIVYWVEFSGATPDQVIAKMRAVALGL